MASTPAVNQQRGLGGLRDAHSDQRRPQENTLRVIADRPGADGNMVHVRRREE
jgi:hypothetical protein